MGGALAPVSARRIIRGAWRFCVGMSLQESLISRVNHEEAVGNRSRTRALPSPALSTSGNLLVALRHLFSRL